MVRARWLEQGPGPCERAGPFVPVNWHEAVRLVGDELQRVIDTHGNDAVFGGSYGWSSAGRFHHPQSHVHRFLNVLGGYVTSRGTYSTGAAEIFMPHVIDRVDVVAQWHDWETIVENADLILAFGGIPRKNTFVAPGGLAEHRVHGYLNQYAGNGGRIVNISPLQDDFPLDLPSQWLPISPFGDVPMLLAMSYVLIAERRHDQSFLDRYTVGFQEYEDYVLGRVDGVPKTPRWAQEWCGISATTIAELARQSAESRTLINTTYSLQRSQYGEQPLWVALSFAALLGQIGLPGRGYSYALGSMGNHGAPPRAVPIPSVPQGRNAISTFIPVARIADMLLHPGEPYDYDGHTLIYPDVRLIYWAGGNPFHHHQDLFRLRRAFTRPDTIVVHEQYWTATARHADIVLPSTLSVERHDMGAGRQDRRLIAMHQLAAPYGESRDDYEIFAALADHLGVEVDYTEGRTSQQWLEKMFAELQDSMRAMGFECPSFEQFWETGSLDIPPLSPIDSPIGDFRRDPEAHPLPTPSGRIELCSDVITSFEYDDCPGHATWLVPSERVNAAEAQQGYLQLLANNPASRLHSQLDMGRTSQDTKVSGREPLRLNPRDAAVRGIDSGDVVRVWNERGGFLAGAVVTSHIVAGAVQVSTGAWFDPVAVGDREICIHGNPNVVTADVGTSRLAQGCSGQLCRVQVERFTGEAPEVSVTREPPPVRHHVSGTQLP